MESSVLVGLLAEPVRRKVVAAMILGAQTIAEIVAHTGEATRDVAKALERLEQRDLVTRSDTTVHLAADAFESAARDSARRPPTEALVLDPDPDPERAAVMRSFFADGRLTRMPTQRKKRLVVLDTAAQRFELGRLSTENAVNLELGQLHADTASLRRALVDEGFMTREAGRYWRTGGTVTLPDDTMG